MANTLGAILILGLVVGTLGAPVTVTQGAYQVQVSAGGAKTPATVTVTPGATTTPATVVVATPGATLKTPAAVVPAKTPAVVVAPAVRPIGTKQQPVTSGLCPAPRAVCDLWYAPLTAVRANLQPSNGNQIISGGQVYTKQGRPVTSLASGSCAVIGEPNTACSSFGFMPAAPGDKLASVLGVFPIGPEILNNLKGKCIKLGINNFAYDGKWVNVNDGNAAFPANKRCILIQT